MPTRHRQTLLTLLVALAAASAGRRAWADDAADVDRVKVRKVKAAFLLNFARFIEWPANVPASPDAPFQIGVIGTDPFGSVLDETVKGRTVGGRSLVVRRLNWALRDDREAAAGCQILYVGDWRDATARTVAATLGKQPVLLVGEGSDLAAGGAIGFSIEAGRVTVCVSRKALAEQQLNASSQLLKVARLVESPASQPSLKP